MDAKFTITIEMGNETMSSRDDVSKAVRIVAEKIKHGAEYGSIMDDNGNKVGEFSFD